MGFTIASLPSHLSHFVFSLDFCLFFSPFWLKLWRSYLLFSTHFHQTHASSMESPPQAPSKAAIPITQTTRAWPSPAVGSTYEGHALPISSSLYASILFLLSPVTLFSPFTYFSVHFLHHSIIFCQKKKPQSYCLPASAHQPLPHALPMDWRPTELPSSTTNTLYQQVSREWDPHATPSSSTSQVFLAFLRGGLHFSLLPKEDINSFSVLIDLEEKGADSSMEHLETVNFSVHLSTFSHSIKNR